MQQLEFDFTGAVPASQPDRPRSAAKRRAKAAPQSARIFPFPNKRRVHLVRYAAEQMARLPPEFAKEWLSNHLAELRREAWAEADVRDAVLVQREYMAAVRCLEAYLRADRGCRPSGRPTRRA
ncbi:DUF6074 family protein [Chelativorans intermedius]|uniref:DUF6074 family protein n=1 Tax=Chelativorans intermedius TaxID=515947 RepID=A0ABV6D7G2_9HYPH|nr:DUF6074 family protein [Chelativorans intermedius]MCT8999218.1 DUF6074 family protein [Chelativorans intermedius]